MNKQIKKKQQLIASLDAALDQHEMELNVATNLFAAKKSILESDVEDNEDDDNNIDDEDNSEDGSDGDDDDP